MSGARVRRGGGAKAKTRKSSSPKASVSRRIAKTLPVNQARANRLAGFVFGGFLLAIGVVVLVALDIPAKAERSAGAAVGRAGFVVSPRFGLAFDPGEPSWVTALARHCLPQWEAL